MEEDMSVLLEPLIDTISSLIVGENYLNFGDPEAVDSLMPILDAVMEFIGIARSIAATMTNPELAAHFLACCDKISAAREKAATAVEKLIANPNDQALYDGDFLEGLRALTEHVGALLQAHGASFEKQTEATKQDVEAAVDGVLGRVHGSNQDLVAAAGTLMAAMKELVKIATQALDNTDNEIRIKMIQDALADFKAAGPAFVMAANEAAQKAQDTAVQRKLQRSAETLKHSAQDIAIALTMSFKPGQRTLTHRAEKGVLDATERLANSQERLMRVALAKKGTVPASDLVDAAKSLLESTAATVAALQKAAAETTDPEQKQALNELAEQLKKDSQAVVLAAKAAAEKPDDPAAKKALEDAVAKALETTQKAREAVSGKEGWGLTPSSEDTVAAATAAQTQALANLTGAAQNPAASKEDVSRAAAAFEDATAKSAAALDAAKADVRNPQQVKRIEDAVTAMKKEAPLVVAAAAAFKETPNPQTKKDLMKEEDKMLDTIQEARAAALGQGVGATPAAAKKEIATAADAARGATERLVASAQKGKSDDVVSSGFQLEDASENLIQKLRDAADKTDDPVQQYRLRRDADQLESMRGPDAAAAASQDPSADQLDKDAIAALDKLAAAAEREDASAKPGVSPAEQKRANENLAKAAAAADSAVRAAAGAASSPDATQALLNQADALKEKEKAFEQQAQKTQKDPSPAQQKALAQAKQDLLDEIEKTKAAIREEPVPEKQLESLMDATDKTVAATVALQDAVHDPTTAHNPAAVAAKQKELEKTIPATIAAINAAANSATDPEVKKKLTAAAQKVPAQASAVNSAAAAVSANPDDIAAKLYFDRAADELLSTMKDVRLDAALPPSQRTDSSESEHLPIAEQRHLAKDLDNLALAAKDAVDTVHPEDPAATNPAVTKQKAQELAEVGKVAAAAVAAAANDATDPDTGAHLADLAKRLELQADDLAAKTNAAAARPADPVAAAAMENAKAALDHTVQEVKDTVAPAPRSDAAALPDNTASRLADIIRDNLAANEELRNTGLDKTAPKEQVAAANKDMDAKTHDTLAALAGAAAQSNNPAQKRALENAADKIRAQVPIAREAQSRSAANPGNPAAAATLTDSCDAVAKSLNEALAAANGDVPLAADQQKELGKALDDAAAAAVRERESAKPGVSPAEQKAANEDLHTKAPIAVAAAKRAAAESDDVSQSQALARGADKLADAAKKLEGAAQAAQADPANPAKQAAAEQAKDDVLKAIDDIRRDAAGAAIAPTAQNNVAAATNPLAQAVQQLKKEAQKDTTSPQELNKKAADVAAATPPATQAIRDAARTTQDPVLQQKLNQDAAAIEKAEQKVQAAAAKAASAPTDPIAKMELQKACDDLLDAIGDARHDVFGATPPSAVSAPAAALAPNSASSADAAGKKKPAKNLLDSAADVAKANREVVRAANVAKSPSDVAPQIHALTDSADALGAVLAGAAADNPHDPSIQKLADTINQSAADVNAAAAAVAAKPTDTAAKQKLKEASERLDNALADVIAPPPESTLAPTTSADPPLTEAALAAMRAVKEMDETATPTTSPEHNKAAAQDVVAKTDAVVRALDAAAAVAGAPPAADPQKKEQLNKLADKVAEQAKAAVAAQEKAAANPADPAAQAAFHKADDDLVKTLADVIALDQQPSKTPAPPVTGLTPEQTLAAVKAIEEAQRQLDNVGKDVDKAAASGSVTPEERARPAALQKALSAAEDAVAGAANATTDPQKKGALGAAAEQLHTEKNVTPAAAVAAEAAPKDAAKKEDFEAARKDTAATLQAAKDALTGDTLPKDIQRDTLAALDNVLAKAHDLDANTRGGTPDADVAASGAALAAAAKEAAKKLDTAAKAATDPVQKDRLRKAADRLQGEADDVIAAAKVANANPSDPGAVQDKKNALDDLKKSVLDAQRAVKPNANPPSAAAAAGAPSKYQRQTLPTKPGATAADAPKLQRQAPGKYGADSKPDDDGSRLRLKKNPPGKYGPIDQSAAPAERPQLKPTGNRVLDAVAAIAAANNKVGADARNPQAPPKQVATNNKALQEAAAAAKAPIAAAIAETSDPVQKSKLADGAKELDTKAKAVDELVQRSAPKAEIAAASDALNDTLRDILAAVTDQPGGSSDVQQRLDDHTAALGAAAQDLATASTPADLAAKQKALDEAAKQIELDVALASVETKDQKKRAQLLLAAERVRLDADGAIKDATVMAANPNDPSAQPQLKQSTLSLLAAAKGLTRAIKVTKRETGSLFPPGSLVAAAEDATANPNDPVAQAKLAQARSKAVQAISAAASAGGEGHSEAFYDTVASEYAAATAAEPRIESSVDSKPELAEVSAESSKFSEDLMQKSKRGVDASDIVIATAEAARLAVEVGDIAAANASAQNKAAIDAARKELDAAAKELVEAQKYASEHPDDPAAQQRVADAYRKLNEAVAKVLAVSGNDPEIQAVVAAVKQMAANSSAEASGGSVEQKEALAAGANVLGNISKSFLPGGKRVTGKEAAKVGKEISDEVAGFLAKIDEMLAKSTDPVYKARLEKMKKTIKDRALQLKIITAVKANITGPEAQEAIESSAKLLAESIAEAQKVMDAINLRKNFTKAVDNIIVLRKAVSAFKKPLKKK
eukprot:TRINITY_DN244_c0_g1_i5.p1 TRINITY_DN244_c0_g1~~TRINITY_DN244_c0_g1_i5.p1  ORF type:complete len:2624 (+),score=883.97 TRINITY_DN244_c0_g1_i5:36-7907(+)